MSGIFFLFNIFEELAKNAREAQGVAAVTGLQPVALGGTLW